jgi:hypothetical protein
VVYSNFVTTVSPSHLGEARFGDGGFGLDRALHAHQVKSGSALEARPGLGVGLGHARDQYAGGTIRLWLNAGGGLTTLTKLIIPLSS